MEEPSDDEVVAQDDNDSDSDESEDGTPAKLLTSLDENEKEAGGLSKQAALFFDQDIFKDIGVSPSAPSTSGGTIASFTQSYTVNSGGGSGSGSEVPEPMTLMLLGSGLLAVGLMRHRTRTE